MTPALFTPLPSPLLEMALWVHVVYTAGVLVICWLGYWLDKQ